MKMILFRPTLVCGVLALSSLLSSPVSAMPQFGRPFFWALDDVPTSDSGSGKAAQSGPAGFVNPEPLKNATDDTSVLSQDGSSGSTSGALHHLGGGVHLPVVLVVSAAASAAFLVF